MSDRPAIMPLRYEPEAARLLGITPRALRSEREAGRIGYRRVAGRIMYGEDDLAEWGKERASRETASSQLVEISPELPAVDFSRAPPRGFVYFIVSENGFVKIGFSVTPKRRLSALQSGADCRLKLAAVIPGYQYQERRAHRQFAEYRTRGEWFRFEGKLREFVEAAV